MISPVSRSMAVVLLLGTVTLASPAWAQATAKIPPSQTTSQTKAETVDQRIATLHAELKITPAEEPDWKAVAQIMRDNAAALQKLAAEKQEHSRQGMTAVDDLETYSDFAQAHLDGLKKLTPSFQTLYDSMPASQKKIADQVFQQSMERRAAHREAAHR